MNKIKIIFFDIDGTLIDMNTKKISIKTIETLKRLKQNNIILAIASGRAPMELPDFNDIEVDVFLTYNGSYCFNHQGTIFSNVLQTDDVHKIIKNAASLNRPLSLATKDRIASNGKDQDLIEYFGFANIQISIDDDFYKVANEKVYQIMMGGKEKDYPKILKDVQHAKIAAWWDRAIDIVPANGGKGLGIQKVLEYYHLDVSEAMAFGDGNNDIEMFKSVGCSVAMGNASQELKDIATDICDDVAHDGIYHYCIKHKLI